MLDQHGNSLPLLLIEMSKFGHSEEIQYIPGDLLGHINVLIITTMAICRNKRLGPQTFTYLCACDATVRVIVKLS